MSPGQITALFTMVEYIARLTVEIRTDMKKIREISTQENRRLRERCARHQAEKMELKKQIKELEKFQ